MSATVTRRQAESTLAAVTTAFASWVQDGYGPTLMQDWDGHDFVICWEEGAPYGWTYLLGGGVEEEFGFKVPAAKIPSTVWLEPVDGCVVALYRT